MAPQLAILGAGPSGLALGRLLEGTDIDYIILERDPSPAAAIRRGGTLDIHSDSGQIALRRAGLMDHFKSSARYEQTTTIADSKGVVQAVFKGSGDDDRPEIDREDLRALLLASIPAKRIRWGLQVQHVQKDASGSMSVHFVNGQAQSGFRLVIGADGAWSKARSLVTSARPQYSGLHYLTTTIAPGSPRHETAVTLAGQGNYMAYGDGKHIAAQKLGDDSYYIAVGLRLPEDWREENRALRCNPAGLRQWLLGEHFVDWPPPLKDMISHSEGDFHVWPLYAMPTEALSWQTVPGIALIGDAAHVSTPFAGGGVNCALFDSVQLAEQIIRHGRDDLDRAVAEYEKLMFPRAVVLITESATNGELLFAPDTPHSFLRAFGLAGAASDASKKTA